MFRSSRPKLRQAYDEICHRAGQH